MTEHNMTERDTLASIRSLLGYISDLLAQDIAPTEANANLLQEADCLLTGAVSLLTEATGTSGVMCSYTSCGKNYCSPMPSEGACTAQENGRVVGSCAAPSRPGSRAATRPAAVVLPKGRVDRSGDGCADWRTFVVVRVESPQPSARDRAAVREAIDRVGLTPQADRRLATLSGGQQQRAFIAKALAGDPELLVLDEPTTGVDVEAQDAVAALLQQLRDELGVTILYISHEFGAVERFVERLVLVRGGIVFDGPPSDLPDVWHDPSHAHA